MKIIKEKIVFDKKLVVEEAKIVSGKNKFSRQRLNSQDAVAVLVLNNDTKKIILTRQFRYAIAGKSGENIIEIVAGKIEGHDTPEKTAIRECEEEIGYRIRKNQLRFLSLCFSSPGYTSEQFYIYFATVKNSDKVSKGGGLAEENENIEVVEMDVDQFKNQITNGEVKDAKTYIAGLFFILNAMEQPLKT
jgi:nudix-type nucleoside diphosphatase (YffH/AdpP family)